MSLKKIIAASFAGFIIALALGCGGGEKAAEAPAAAPAAPAAAPAEGAK